MFKTSHQQLQSYGDWATALVSSNSLGSQAATPGLSAKPRQILDILGDLKVDPGKYKRNCKQAIAGDFGYMKEFDWGDVLRCAAIRF